MQMLWILCTTSLLLLNGPKYYADLFHQGELFILESSMNVVFLLFNVYQLTIYTFSIVLWQSPFLDDYPDYNYDPGAY